jgi:hypothetical protein
MAEPTSSAGLSGNEAGPGERRLTPEQIEEIHKGREFLHYLFSIFRTAAYHSSNNQAMEEPSKAFVEILAWSFEHYGGSFKMEVGQGQMFLAMKRLRPTPRQQPAVDSLDKFFQRRGIGGLFFKAPLEPDQVRMLATTVAAFKRPLDAQDGVAALKGELSALGLLTLLEPVPPLLARVKSTEDLAKELGTQGRNAVTLAKGVAMVKAAAEDDSEIARAGARHVVRQMSDLELGERDLALGMSMMAASQDMGMRSLTVLLVVMSMAEALQMPRELRADLGQACLELVRWDKKGSEEGLGKERDVEGLQALAWLAEQKHWSVSALRQGISLAGRYLPPRGDQEGGVGASRLSEILRAASDYVDLTLPTPMRQAEYFLKGGPYAPHEALEKMRQQVGKRYSRVILAALVRGVGVLPVGTPVELADGLGAVVVERCEDPMLFIVQENLSGRTREASFKPGPGQIARVITGGDLLKVRSRFLLGSDHAAIDQIAKQLIEEG